MDATCLTPGCENEGITLVVDDTWTDLVGDAQPVTAVQCGPCQQWIIPPAPEPEPAPEEP